jgi:hypothetical protein
MAKTDHPLKVEIPAASQEQPVWSRVGIVGIVGFVIGIAWPKVAGIKIGPSVPTDLRATAEAVAPKSAAPPAVSAPAAAPAASASAAPKSENQQLVIVGKGSITKCFDKKDKKVDECDKVPFDGIASKKLGELSKCPAALGLEGKLTIGLDLQFDKKEVVVQKSKKASAGSKIPSSTVQGVLQCAGRELSGISLADIKHKHRRYSIQYVLTFYPPGKRPEAEGAEAADKGGEKGEDSASGAATVAWDTALVRKDPKDGDIVARIVRGTRVKIVGRQGEWYRIESGSKNGWVYRSAIGL